MRRICAFLSALTLCFAGPGLAEPYPEPSDPYVNDFADLITPGIEAETRSALATLYSETGIEMTVVTLKTRDDFDPSASVEVFAQGLFNAWGIGDRERNDGILLLVVAADREARIELGAAYGQGYDVIAQDIVSSAMVPEFRDGKFGTGIEHGALAVIDRIALRLAGNLPATARPSDAPQGVFERLDGWFFGLVFVAISVYGLFGRRIGDRLTRLRRCPGCGRRTLRSERSIRPPDNGSEPQLELHRVVCRHCNFRDEREPRPMRSRPARSGDQSRGGFGGGRSSGGGASGRW